MTSSSLYLIAHVVRVLHWRFKEKILHVRDGPLKKTVGLVKVQKKKNTWHCWCDNTGNDQESALCLRSDATRIYASSNRFNLRFCVKKVKKDVQLKELKWLVDLILEQKMNCPKAIVFCNTMNEIALIFALIFIIVCVLFLIEIALVVN